MRPLKRSAIGVGVLFGGGSLLLGVMQFVGAGNLALASGATSEPTGMCSDATLHGTYNFATESVQEPGAVPFAYAGFVTYDGKGRVSEIYTISFNGVVSRAVRETGTYSVNPDCTSSEVDSGPGSIGTQHYDGFLKPDGSEFMYIQTDPRGCVGRRTHPHCEGVRSELSPQFPCLTRSVAESGSPHRCDGRRVESEESCPDHLSNSVRVRASTG